MKSETSPVTDLAPSSSKAVTSNAIILTSGLSGSSVLTGLLSRAGFWTGESTHKKAQYDTFENEELITLNLKIFKEAAYNGNYMMEFSEKALNRIGGLYEKIDSQPYWELVNKCEQHRPWIWKDPRLWLTIRFWKNLLPLEHCRFILLTRDLMQTWVSQTLRRQITTYRYSRNYEQRIQQSVMSFFRENALPHLMVSYEDLIVHPARTIDRLNRFLDIQLGVDDLRKVYRKPLHKSPRRSWVKHLQAVAIYVKNYSERLDLKVNGE
jgi:hypothetical protein